MSTPKMTERIVIAPDDTELFVREWRSDEPRPTIVIVHGLAEHSGRYEHVGTFLSERGYDVLIPDLRGHGRSGGPRGDIDSFHRFHEDLQFLVNDLVVPTGTPWVLYGHSMGGLIVEGYLEEHHLRPDAAVLSAPGLEDELPQALKKAAEVLGRFLPTVPLPNTIRGDQLSTDPAVGEAYFADPLVFKRLPARFGRAGLTEQRRVREREERIDVPTFVIHGAEDTVVPPSASAKLAALDGVDRKLYPGLRHEIHNEPESDQVLSDVADWLDAALA
jgi:alpha-beta hydrolase superfamily lysophospholipase